jgi:hypothetical protein
MTRISHADDPEARRLREAITEELTALRQAWPFRTRSSPASGGDVADHLGHALRSNPAWAAGAAAGALAGVVAAVRSRLRRRDRE